MMTFEARWRVYLARCNDGTLYCGISTNVPKRIREHGGPRGARYTRTRSPVRLDWESPPMTHGSALALERKIKRAPRATKEAIILGTASAG